jgi:hypothetical protein
MTFANFEIQHHSLSSKKMTFIPKCIQNLVFAIVSKPQFLSLPALPNLFKLSRFSTGFARA